MLTRTLLCLCLPFALTATTYTPEELTDELMNELIDGTRSELCVRFDAGSALPLSLTTEGVISGDAVGCITANETLFVRFDDSGVSFALQEGQWRPFTELFTGNIACQLGPDTQGLGLTLVLEPR